MTPDWLARMVRDFRENWPRAGAVSSVVLPKRPAEPPAAAKQQTLNFLGSPVEGFFAQEGVLFYPEGCAFVYAKFLAPEGPFDPDYFDGGEEVYFGWRLRLLGRSIHHSSSARVFHEEDILLTEFPEWKRIYYQTRNRWLNLFLFYETLNFVKILPWIGLEMVCLMVKSLGTGFHSFLGRFLAVFWFATHASLVLRKRRGVQSKRKVADGEIIKYLSGRVAPDGAAGSRVLNLISLAYCGWVGLEVVEFMDE